MRWFKYMKQYPNGSNMTYHVDNAWFIMWIIVNIVLYDRICEESAIKGTTVSYWGVTVPIVILTSFMLLHVLLQTLIQLVRPTDYWKSKNTTTQ